MSTMTNVQTLGANASVENILGGKVDEFLGRPSAVRIGITGAAAGVFLSVLIGNTNIINEQEIGAQNRFPIDPDDFIVETVGAPGDRLVVGIRNSTGAGIIVRTVVKVVELG